MGKVDDIKELAKEIEITSKDSGFKIGGPAFFDWGYDGSPNVSFWYKDRRVHFYFEGVHGRIYIMVEAAEMGPPRRVRVAQIQTSEEAWAVVRKFLRQRVDYDRLPGHEWLDDFQSVDSRIPHPPEADTEPSVQLVGKIEEPASRTKPARDAGGRPRPPGAAKPAVVANVVGIGALTLYSNDPAKLAAWYQEKLGIAFQEQEGSYTGALGTSGMAVSIFRSDSPIPDGARPIMINLRVSNFDGFLEQMVSKGAEVLGMEKTKLGKFAWTKDADGNPIELWEN